MIATKFRYGYVLSALLSVFSFGLSAQNDLSPYKNLYQYNYENWDSDDGLPVNSIIDVIHASSGYIWFVSYGGITRFNGNEFFTYSTYNYPSIINNSYTHLFEDDQGTIWASSSGGGVTAIRNDSVITYTDEHGLPSNFIEEVNQDKNGRIWIATSNGLYYKLGDKFLNDDTPEPLKGSELKSLDVDDTNSLWVATVDEGIYQLSSGRVVRKFTQNEGLLSNNVNYVKAEVGSVWVGTDAGLSRILGDSIVNIGPQDGLIGSHVTSSLVDNNGQLWVGAYRGLTRIDNGKFSGLPPSHPLYQQDITSMVQDLEGNLWVGTYRLGLYKVWDGKFTNYSGRSVDNKPFVVHSVIQQTDSTFIVVHHEGVSILNTRQNTLEELDLNYDIKGSSLKSGMLDSKGNLWISSLKFLLKYSKGRSVIYNTSNGLAHENIRLSFEDSKGNIWVGTTNGLSVISAEGTITNYTTADGLSHEYIMSFDEDDEGSLWIGTRNGLNRYKDGKFTQYFAKDGLAGDFVFKTFRDDNALWVCGNAGMTRYKDGKFTTITTADGLASNTVFQILKDRQGYFWITTNQKGVTVFKVKSQELNDFMDNKIDAVKCITYTQGDGLKSTAATSSATSEIAEDGKLYFATNNGVERIDPAHIKLNLGPPPVVIEGMWVDNEKVNLHDDVVLPSGRHRVVIKYSALSYVSPEAIAYEYKLEGFDDDWETAYGNRSTSYTNLPYGNYTFMVSAANSDGIWNREAASVSFYIKPSFYETDAFIVGVLFLVLLSAVLVYNLRVRSLKKAQRELAYLVNERTSEIVHQKEEIESQKEAIEIQQEQIEHKNRELQKINLHLEDIVEERTVQLKKAYSELLKVNKELDTFIYRSVHDVRGPIARLQGLSHLIALESSDQSVLELVGLLNNTANEMNDVFYRLLNVVRLKASELNIQEVPIESLIKDVFYEAVDGDIDRYTLSLKVAPDFRLLSDRETVEIILRQLISNAVKFTQRETRPEVIINCQVKDHAHVRISVADNGMGIDKEVRNKIFDMFFVGQDVIQGAGLGLYTVKSAVRVLRGKIRLVKSELDGGSVFEVILPSNLS